MAVNPEYPAYVNEIISEDILKRDENDPVRIAYRIAVDLHQGQKRKGIDEMDYITHPLQVYDLVSRCLPINIKNRDVTLAAALLHDTIEDYKKDEIKSGKTSEDDARAEAIKIIESRFTNKDLVKKILYTLHDLTNPVEFMDKNGEKTSKTEWQVEHIKTASQNAKLIKICDKTLNIVSNIEEVPNWDHEKLLENSRNSKAVVDAAKVNIRENDEYYKPIILASKIYDHVAEEKFNLLEEMIKDGRQIPPKHQTMSFSFRTIMAMISQENTINR